MTPAQPGIKTLDSGKREEWCTALHGNHDEHRCHKKAGHEKNRTPGSLRAAAEQTHECTCGVWW